MRRTKFLRTLNRRLAKRTSNPLPGSLRRENVRPPKDLYANVHHGTFHNSEKLEITHTSIGWHVYTHTGDAIWTSKPLCEAKEVGHERPPTVRVHGREMSRTGKSVEAADWRFPVAGGWRGTANGHNTSFWSDRNILKLDCNNDWKSLEIY